MKNVIDYSQQLLPSSSFLFPLWMHSGCLFTYNGSQYFLFFFFFFFFKIPSLILQLNNWQNYIKNKKRKKKSFIFVCVRPSSSASQLYSKSLATFSTWKIEKKQTKQTDNRLTLWPCSINTIVFALFLPQSKINSRWALFYPAIVPAFQIKIPSRTRAFTLFHAKIF